LRREPRLVGGGESMAGKTNVIRIVESLGITYETALYEAGEEHHDAVAVARRIGVEPEIVFKTLVARSEKGEIAIFCIPAPLELDLKKAARAAGAKKVELVGLKELLPLTGSVRGGCSPLGMKKDYPTWIDETALLHERIYVNAGCRGMQVILAAEDLRRACGARFSDLT
jgi:Cys-tRNA(Pro)/Cys-tRNA(Cys) deacylase